MLLKPPVLRPENIPLSLIPLIYSRLPRPPPPPPPFPRFRRPRRLKNRRKTAASQRVELFALKYSAVYAPVQGWLLLI